jgi:protein involved in polysaccharide export with SLBB domain
MRVSLGNIRSIQVNIMGEVVLPGTYTLSSFSSLFHALYSAGGVNRIGSLRDIKLIRDGKTISTVDVYEYLIKGESSGNITLREGDLVKVEPYSKRIQITGQVKRPMIYELKANENLSSIIKYAGDFTSNAYRKNINITRRGDTEMQIFTIEADSFDKFDLKDGDVVRVSDILDRYENRVSIEGSVFRPGSYAIGDKIQTVTDLVKYAEGPTEDAFLARTLLYRQNPDLSTTVESINLGMLINNNLPDIKLRRNDRLYVPSQDELRDERNVTLSGEIKRPGLLPLRKKYEH